MSRLRGWFTLLLLMLTSCSLVTSPTPISTSPDIPSVSPVIPTVPPSMELRIRVTTTSDWTTVNLVDWKTVGNFNIVSSSLEATNAAIDQNLISLSQPIGQAESGQTVEMVVDLSVEEKPFNTDRILEIDRGHLGETTVEIYNFTCSSPSLVATLTWDGIQPAGANKKQFTIPAAQLFGSPPNDYIVIAQLNFWYYGPGLSGGFENSAGDRNTRLFPLLGDTYAAADPGNVYQQIEWAAAYGVDAFSIEWTTPRGEGCCGSMENTLDDVFLKSSNIDKVRWVIFYDFPLRLMQTSGLEKYAVDFDFDEEQVYSTFVYDFRRFAHKYFGNPQYLTIDGRPVIYIWATNAFQGNIEGAIQDAREAVAEEGYDVFIVGDEIIANRFSAHHASLFDGVTTFTFLIPGLDISAWEDIGDAIPQVDRTFTQWQGYLKGLKVAGREEYVNFQPAWAPQYDDRLVDHGSTYVPATSKEQVTEMAEMARSHAQPVGSQDYQLVWINTWNCWGETTTIEPTAKHGEKYPAGNYQFDMLEVVREVFGIVNFACENP